VLDDFVFRMQSDPNLRPSLSKSLDQATCLVSFYGERLEFDVSMQGTKLSLIRKITDTPTPLTTSRVDWSRQIELVHSLGNVPNSKPCKTSRELLERLLTTIVKADRSKPSLAGAVRIPRMLFNL